MSVNSKPVILYVLMFRFLMIKYSERGLVSGGPNLELYNKLFWTATSIFLLLYHTIMMAVNLREDNFVQRTISGSMCSDPSKPFNLSKYWTENSKNIVLRVCFVSFTMGLSFILFYQARTSRTILKQNSRRVKVQIGKFRRNILTLKETVTPMVLLTVTEIARILVVQQTLAHEEQGEDLRKTTKNIIIVLNLLVSDLLISVILPCIVATNIYNEIPELRNTTSSVGPQTISCFYTRKPRQLVPRRDVQIYPDLQPVRYVVKPRCCSQLPEVEC